MTEIGVGAVLAVLTVLPVAWKWGLGIARAVVVTILLALAAGAVVALLDAPLAIGPLVKGALVWAGTLLLSSCVLLWRFYRDPERTAPEDSTAIVSPADGEVVYVRRFRQGVLPASNKRGRTHTLQELVRTSLASDDAIVVGIGLSFLDVHVSRAPTGGRIALQRHFPGRFGSLRQPEMVFENERATTVIERPDLQLAVVLIASRLVRQIVPFVGEGDNVGMGQRIGTIRLGSQVDLVLPADGTVEIKVEPGERVVAGESIVAVAGPRPHGSPAAKGVLGQSA
jgi:phosphatidylserine decarboxylase